MGVEARQVEQIRDETLEATRLGLDDLGRADPLLRRLGGAMGERFRVAADRRERRAQVVRHAEEKCAFESTSRFQLLGHVVDALAQVDELVTLTARHAGASGQVAARDAVRGRFHGRQWTGHPPSKDEGHDHRGDERHRPGEEKERARSTERVLVELLCEDEHGRVGIPRKRLQRLGDVREITRDARLLGVLQQAGCIEVTGVEAGRNLEELFGCRCAGASSGQRFGTVAHLSGGRHRDD